MAERILGEQQNERSNLHRSLMSVVERYQAVLLEREYLKEKPEMEEFLARVFVSSAQKVPVIEEALSYTSPVKRDQFTNNTRSVADFVDRAVGLVGGEIFSKVVVPRVQEIVDEMCVPRGTNGLSREDAMFLVNNMEIGHRLLATMVPKNGNGHSSVENSSSK